MDLKSNFKVKLCDGEVLEVPDDIVKVSPYFENLLENDPEDGEAYDLSLTEIKSGVLKFILGHLDLHNYDPPGESSIASPVTADLSKNILAKDYEYVKGLSGMENIDNLAEHVKVLNKLDISKLRIIYITILATEFTMEGRKIKEMNEKFADL